MKWMKLFFFAVLFIVLVAYCVMFATRNSDQMSVDLVYTSIDPVPKWQVILSAAIIGALISCLFFVVQLIILESKNIVLRRVNKKMERALKQNATSPVLTGAPTSYAADPSLSDSDV
jgi:uncharacterized integral membrane protein